ncbi:MAG: biopolymer transporter ExbD [Ignavibacteriae bacterium]|nr:biopolymer transporter ExbD [Ignavibacteriota bacterium]MCB9209976.1 biopolymer transporter ExbD [Ignavibacteriales bacterium]MCB9218639.1 biopolymer transporter ExbD [Ignavibacteriales bacterium]MCB9259355.1 biopolymer transporter ExbD [Ignavibacteriales bacterium]
MKFESSRKPLSVFSLSSLTDIVFLLLIFFLLTSQFVIQTGVKVKLPASKLNEQSLPTKLIVSITEDNNIYLGSEQMDISQLAINLDKQKESLVENNLVIRADKTVDIDLVIQVIDAAKSAGIDRFTIETEKQSL